MLLQVGNNLVNTEKITRVEYTPVKDGGNAIIRVFFPGAFETHLFLAGKDAEVLWNKLSSDARDVTES